MRNEEPVEGGHIGIEWIITYISEVFPSALQLISRRNVLAIIKIYRREYEKVANCILCSRLIQETIFPSSPDNYEQDKFVLSKG